jgi:hypothetical protein
VRSALRQGSYVERSAMRVATYLREVWLPATKPPQVKYQT